MLILEFRKSSSLFFLVPTDFTDAHRFLTYSWPIRSFRRPEVACGCSWGRTRQASRRICNPPSKKCPNLFGICGFAIRSKQECCCWIRAHNPSFFFEKDGIFTFSSFKALGGVPDMVFLKMGGKNGKNRIYHLNNKIYPLHCTNATPWTEEGDTWTEKRYILFQIILVYLQRDSDTYLSVNRWIYKIKILHQLFNKT